MSDMKLYEGINHIDDDLIEEADVPVRRPKYYTFAFSAAAVLIIMGMTGINFGGNGKYEPDKHIVIENATSATVEMTSTVTSTYGTKATSFTTTSSEKGTTAINTTISENVQTKITAETAVSTVTDSVQPVAVQSTVSDTCIPAASVQTKPYATTVQTTFTVPETVTTTSAVKNEEEQIDNMKKLMSMFTAAAMLTPLESENTYSSDIEYKDPAEKYAVNPYVYYEPANRINPAEKELFDKIDRGLIDIDIDRNGELDMRDAMLLETYEMWKYINAHPEIADDGGYSWTKQYLNIDFRAPSEEAMKFLENRENIRNKEFFLQSRHYNGFGVVCLDAELIMRYHLLNTLKPEYFDEEYYMDTIGYPRIEVFDYIYNVERMKEKSPETYEKYSKERVLLGGAYDEMLQQVGCLSSFIRQNNCKDLEPLYDLNEDGVFDLHDCQDYFLCELLNRDWVADLYFDGNRDWVSSDELYAPFREDEKSVTETVYNNFIKLEKADNEYKKIFTQYFSDLNRQAMLDIYFTNNDFKLIYTTPEYYTDNRPGCENLPIDNEDRNLCYQVEMWGTEHGYINEKLKTAYDDDAFYTFFDEWSTKLDNSSCDVLDVNANEEIDSEDFEMLFQYLKEVLTNLPAEASLLPEDVRFYLDRGFDLNKNGISGDITDIFAAEYYIMSRYPQYIGNVDVDKAYSAYSAAVSGSYAVIDIKDDVEAEEPAVSLIGDANCDGKVSVSDSVTILLHIGNRDKYDLTEQGKKNADVNGDGSITGTDAVELQKIDANKYINK